MDLSYYCFNNRCKVSVYSKTTAYFNFPLTLASASEEYICHECRSRLLSIVDISIKGLLLESMQKV